MRRLSFTTYCGLLVLAPVICAGANDTEWTKRKFENRSLPESILNQEDHFAGRERKSELLMKEIKRLQESQATNTRTATSSKRVQKKTTAEPHHDPEVSGIDDIDKIRAEVRATPTDASNIMSRRTALYRWWRLLWHQGYDMNMSNYNAIWNRVLRSRLKTIFFLFDPFEQQVDHSNLDQGFAMVGQHLIISGMSAKIHQPRKRALDDPTAW